MAEFPLPAVYGITAVALFQSIDAFLGRLDAALDKGLGLLQVRDKQLAPADRERLAHECVARCHARDCLVLINGDEQLAERCGADGVHLGSDQLGQQRSRTGLTGVSCHSAAELDRGLVDLQADFAVLSPVLETLTHVDASPLGWEGFASLAQGHRQPVYALGGLTPGDAPCAQEHGGAGVACMRAVWGLPGRQRTAP